MPQDALAPVASEGLLAALPDQTRNVEVFDPLFHGMLPVGLGMLTPGRPCPVDLFMPLYLESEDRVEMTQVCRAGEVFRPAWRQRLVSLRQGHLYVPRETAADLLSQVMQRGAEELVQRPAMLKRTYLRELAIFALWNLMHADGDPAALAACLAETRRLVELIAAQEEMLARLAPFLRADPSLFSHSVNVCLTAMALARHLDFSDVRVVNLGLAGLLHDLGRSRLPKGLWEKPGRLSLEETRQMQRHPRLGHAMLAAAGGLPPQVLLAVLHHHENADGSGYPGRLPAASTPMLARWLRLIDAFDAMTSHRSHRKALSAFAAVQAIVADADRCFGPDLTPQFVGFLTSQFVNRPPGD